MERESLRPNALENEIELGAVAEAQVAQAEGLLQVVEALHLAQARFTKSICWAAGLGATIAAIISCGFMYWQTQNVRLAAEMALPHMVEHNHDQQVGILEAIDWSTHPSEKNLKLREQLTTEGQARLDRMLNAMRTNPEGWIHFVEHGDEH